MKKFIWITVLGFILTSPLLAMAQAAGGAPELDLLTQILSSVKGFGGLSWVGKVATVVLLLIASMKVSALNNLVWSKLGKFQAAAPLILGMIGGFLSLSADGKVPNLAQVLAYMGAGAGAIILHELLDMVKAIPGIGATWTAIITVIESVLGGPSASPAAVEAPKTDVPK